MLISQSQNCCHQFHQVDQPGQLLVPLQLAHVGGWRLPGQTPSHSASQPEPHVSIVIHPAAVSPVVVVQHLSLLLRLDPPLPWIPAERPQPLVAAHRVLSRDPAVVRALAGAGERQQEEPPHGKHPGQGVFRRSILVQDPAGHMAPAPPQVL